MLRTNPCLSCGACCAYFRVSFYWGESDVEAGGSVPEELTEDVTPFYRCMKGTNQKKPRCTVLMGEVGRAVRCLIYSRRSSTCCDFGIHYFNGMIHASVEELQRCNQARAAWNLPPLFQPAYSHSYQGVPGVFIHPFHISRRRKKRDGGRKPDSGISGDLGYRI